MVELEFWRLLGMCAVSRDDWKFAEFKFCRSLLPIRNNKARSLRLPITMLLINTPKVQVITANSPRGAMIKIIQVTVALAIAMVMVR